MYMNPKPSELETFTFVNEKNVSICVEVFTMEDQSFVAFTRFEQEDEVELAGQGESKDKQEAIDLAIQDLYRQLN
ncbi:hypothetical protein OEV98_06395 [Caldibacillus lycopersici]|uniref:Uncharacterized protein n=1 Tax=Perspicuibacillus lycopersici TaxID=1325689 RepID=A0AAE3LM51_9BACI|nr:hypothetical protein [Perspicuibacillus lycopersici]MCU9613180.1 hypothetical protein [Perspicuibacillus lycopersici]